MFGGPGAKGMLSPACPTPPEVAQTQHRQVRGGMYTGILFYFFTAVAIHRGKKKNATCISYKSQKSGGIQSSTSGCSYCAGDHNAPK